MSVGYELVDHTADIGLRVWGPTPEDVFEEAGRGLFSLVCDPLHVGELETLDLELEVHVRCDARAPALTCLLEHRQQLVDDRLDLRIGAVDRDHVAVTERGDGPAVIFIPGFMQPADAWAPVARLLPERYPSVLLRHERHELDGRLDEIATAAAGADRSGAVGREGSNFTVSEKGPSPLAFIAFTR